MVILFRPYLLDQKAAKSYYVGDLSDTETSANTHLCRWIGCCRTFENLDSLSNHVTKEHANPGKGGVFYCEWSNCNRGDKGFNARYKMLVHVRTHTNEKPHHCYQCNKSFSRAENLKIHSRSHTGEKPYVCNIPGCGKAYSNSSDRFKHSRTHAVDKPYACKIAGCPKRYTDPSSLRKHVKTYKHFPIINSGTLDEFKTQKIVNPANNVHVVENANHVRTICEGISVDVSNLRQTIMPLVQPNHLNEIYLWSQPTRRLQIYDSPVTISDVNSISEEPLDLRIHCD